MIYQLAILFLICGESFGNKGDPEVRTPLGDIRGKTQVSRNGRLFNAFTGIPYAKPPVGELRFKPPVPVEPWEEILDATKPHVACPQSDYITGDFSTFGSEDCLFLNIYRPHVTDSTRMLPIIFYIHGGGFVYGSGSPEWYGADKFMDKDVMLVTCNYRLGALGFITTGDNVVPGNNGLKDQNLALKWIRKYASLFGGHPYQITIDGNSAGAASAHLHVVSPLSKNLLSGAILQSGNALAAWAVARHGEGVKNTKRLAEFLDCPTSSSTLMVDCLRKVDATTILKQESRFWEWSVDPVITFKPVVESNVDGAFLPEHPIDIINSGNIRHIPIMTGFNTEDGALKSSGYYTNPKWIEDINKDFNKVLPIIMQYGKGKNDLSKKLRKYYFGDQEIDNTTRDEVTKMFTDLFFSTGADETVRAHSKHNNPPVYYYLFGYRGSDSFSRIFGDDSYNYGVCHEDELLHLFTLGREFPNFKPTESDQKISELLITLWTNFAITGDPTPAINSIITTKWEPVHTDNLKHYFIKSADQVEMVENLFSDRVNFLRKLDLYSVKTTSKNEL